MLVSPLLVSIGRRAVLLFLLGTVASAYLNAFALRWTPANFRGLILGRSTRDDTLRVLGQPDGQPDSRNAKRVRSPASPAETADDLIYKNRGDHKGDLEVRLDRSGVIVDIQESFPVAIPRSRMYKELGRDAETAHYSLDRCGTLYRDPGGPIELTFYPARGIYLWPDQYGYDFAAIHYAARPPGLARPLPCASPKK